MSQKLDLYKEHAAAASGARAAAYHTQVSGGIGQLKRRRGTDPTCARHNLRPRSGECVTQQAEPRAAPRYLL